MDKSLVLVQKLSPKILAKHEKRLGRRHPESIKHLL